jgi:hypothetical protein
VGDPLGGGGGRPWSRVCLGGGGTADARARWGYSFNTVDGGTEVTETWELPPEGSAFFEKRFGEDAPKEIAARSQAAEHGIEATLAAIKRSAEA